LGSSFSVEEGASAAGRLISGNRKRREEQRGIFTSI
jgi:hypothetical protein